MLDPKSTPEETSAGLGCSQVDTNTARTAYTSPTPLEMSTSQLQSSDMSGPLLNTASSKPSGPIFASIGTVLVDCFDLPPLPSLDTQTPANTSPPSPTSRSTRSLASSFSSLTFAFTAARSIGTLTPQRSFASDDTSPFSSESSSATSWSTTSTSQSQMLEPVEVLGGGALYCLVGARMWLPPKECRTLVDTDEDRRDLSKDQEDELEGYGAGCWAYMEGDGRRMIKARIRYEGTVRLYKHIVPPPQRPFETLLGTPIDGAKYLHISPPTAPSDLCRMLAEQRAVEAREGKATWRPKIVYEPTPLGCHAGQQDSLEECLPHLEVISPNHEELLSLYGRPLLSLSSPLLRPVLEELTQRMLDVGVGEDGGGSVIIRCGRLGCVVGTRQGGVKWFPAYWEEESEDRVKDVTGGGNAFLGGLIAGLAASGGDPYEAALYGTVSASFTVEQIGLPILSDLYAPPAPSTLAGQPLSSIIEIDDEAREVEGEVLSAKTKAPEGQELRRQDIAGELWNGEVPEWRLEVLRRRIAEYA